MFYGINDGIVMMISNPHMFKHVTQPKVIEEVLKSLIFYVTLAVSFFSLSVNCHNRRYRETRRFLYLMYQKVSGNFFS